MFFSASARLADQTPDLGSLAAQLDGYLAGASKDWLIHPDRVAAEFSVPVEDAEHLLAIAASPAVDLLVAEKHVRCTSFECRDFTSLTEVEEAREAGDEIRCASCRRPIPANATAVVAYRLSAQAATEAERRASRPRRKIGILTALELERGAVLAHLTNITRDRYGGTVYHIGEFETETDIWEITTTSIGAGNAGAAADGERLIAATHPEAVFFVGIGGGIKNVALGDVVAADQVVNYHSGKAEKQFIPNPQTQLSSYDLVQEAKATVTENQWQERIIGGKDGLIPKALVDPIASGEQVVASTESETYDMVKTAAPRAVALEMEGFGFLRAAYANSGVGSLVVRGISDLLGNKREADAGGWQPVAAANAAAFAFELIAQLPPRTP
jgi:nucleoside phosphorylase